MTLRVRPTSKLIAYSTIGTVFVIAGIVFSRVEAMEIGVVFIAAVTIGLSLAQRPSLAITGRLVNDALHEGESTVLGLDAQTTTGVQWLEMKVMTPNAIRSGADRSADGAIAVARGAGRHLDLELTTRRWGVYQIGPVRADIIDTFGLFRFQGDGADRMTVRIFPREDRLMRAIRPAETQLFSGDEVARVKGDGIEFAGVRPFEPGDQVRRINWSVSTRLQKLHINELHPEKNADVVVFLDSFSELSDSQDSTLLMAVRAAATVTRHYLRRRDRVGLVTFGGTLRWQLPDMGIRQAYRILDALLRTDAMVSYVWKGIEVIPPATLPPKALVIAISPLLDQRTVRALHELRGRGFDVVVVEVSPLAFTEAPRTEEEKLAYRLWVMKREGVRFGLWSAGIPVTVWSRDQALVHALQEIESFRRYGPKLSIS